MCIWRKCYGEEKVIGKRPGLKAINGLRTVDDSVYEI